MRTQRRGSCAVLLIDTASTEDHFGDVTEDPKGCLIQGAIFEPDVPQERAGEDQAQVLQTGFWNLPGLHAVNAQALIKHGATLWQVTGGGTVWRDRTKVPVQQARKR